MFSQPFVIPALAFIVLAVPLIFRLIPRNGFYGIRTPRTLSDDEIWYHANSLGGQMVVISSVIYLLVAVLAPVTPSAGVASPVWWVHLIMFIGPLFVGIALTLHFIRKLKP